MIANDRTGAYYQLIQFYVKRGKDGNVGKQMLKQCSE